MRSHALIPALAAGEPVTVDDMSNTPGSVTLIYAPIPKNSPWILSEKFFDAVGTR